MKKDTQDIYIIYNSLYNNGLKIKEKSYKTISKEDISDLIIKCKFLKDDIAYFFQLFQKMK